MLYPVSTCNTTVSIHLQITQTVSVLLVKLLSLLQLKFKSNLTANQRYLMLILLSTNLVLHIKLNIWITRFRAIFRSKILLFRTSTLAINPECFIKHPIKLKWIEPNLVESWPISFQESYSKWFVESRRGFYGFKILKLLNLCLIWGQMVKMTGRHCETCHSWFKTRSGCSCRLNNSKPSVRNELFTIVSVSFVLKGF